MAPESRNTRVIMIVISLHHIEIIAIRNSKWTPPFQKSTQTRTKGAISQEDNKRNDTKESIVVFWYFLCLLNFSFTVPNIS